MWLKWLPWKYIVRYMAKKHGLVDPVTILSYLRRFAQPSEVWEPVELLRAGVVMHTRGLMNSRAIQHNLDWLWPYWVSKQFNPHDRAFIPRAFSLTHINLTCRNWTALGIPNLPYLPVVDPAGLVTPLYDKWSIDAWIIDEEGNKLAPARCTEHAQSLTLPPSPEIITTTDGKNSKLTSTMSVVLENSTPICKIDYKAKLNKSGWLAVSVRPYNPEGVSFIHKIELTEASTAWAIEDHPLIALKTAPEKHLVSSYHRGDVFNLSPDSQTNDKIKCDVGMATSAALYRIQQGTERNVSFDINLENDKTVSRPPAVKQGSADKIWLSNTNGLASMSIPDQKMKYLFDVAVQSLILHSPDDVYPGPYTYKRFWFRDAALILNAMLAVGMTKRAEKAIENFFPRQSSLGYFHSQQGEWDSNGQVLWILEKYCRMVGKRTPENWKNYIIKAAKWIVRKRLKHSGYAHDGLLPPGFSAEHLGPNDYYYWDDFWSLAGLKAAANMLDEDTNSKHIKNFRQEADDLEKSISKSLLSCQQRLKTKAMPASPYRRLDSGAVGSIAAGYPLQLYPGQDERLTQTADYLYQNCLVKGGVFQDMVHSGINAYLTCHLAQLYIRTADEKGFELIENVAALASSTGQWPEAIHPQTLTGCMGDGQHIWAAAEWVMALRNALVYEESEKGKLVIGSGIPHKWLNGSEKISLSNAPTEYGPIDLDIEDLGDKIQIDIRGQWRIKKPIIEIKMPNTGSKELKSETVFIDKPLES